MQALKTRFWSSSLPTLNDFWAEWCGPCKMIAPILKELAVEYEGTPQDHQAGRGRESIHQMAYGVQSIPTLILFMDGQPVERIVGYRPKDQLLKQLSGYLPPA